MPQRLPTSYAADLVLLRTGAARFGAAALILALIAAPYLLGPYAVSLVTFILIYCIAGFGLSMLMGFTGQLSLGQGAFFGLGAYSEAILQSQGFSIGWTVPASVAIAALAGVAIGIPALRLSGIYLALATLSFNFIVEEGLARWESVTGGNAGLAVRAPILFRTPIRDPVFGYFLALVFAIGVLLVCLNLLRTPMGRALIAVRDSEISARSIGVNPAVAKTFSFAFSAGVTGLAGALYAHQIRFLSPDQFGLPLSIELLMMVAIGGLGSLWGAVLGAVFVVGLPEFISLLKAVLPASVAGQTGLQPAVFGSVMIAVVLLEPAGLAGLLGKAMTFVREFPLSGRGIFRRAAPGRQSGGTA